MPLRYDVGDTFPPFSLVDDRGKERSFEDLSEGQPLLLVLFRGPW